MTRSRKRKLLRLQARPARRAWVPIASALVAASASLHAQQAASAAGPAVAAAGDTETLGEIVVTAEKRTETLQQVPISIEVLGADKLADMQVSSFDDYAKLLPSMSYVSFGPGQAQLFFRGIATTDGSTPLHAGPASATGMYLDEIPITSIAGNPDLHMYDIQRVEALAGPQGTLYGASSLSGTLRIITNKPNPSKFEAGYDLKGDKEAHGGPGGQFEGFLNIPLSDNVAVRLVGYVDHEGGYIDNVPATRTYTLQTYNGIDALCNNPASPLYGQVTTSCPITISNAPVAGSAFNTTDTSGGRAALKWDVNDQWTVTPTLIYQEAKTNGNFSYDPQIGYLKVTDFEPDTSDDRWYQFALTIEGKIGNYDLVYSGGYFNRYADVQSDYSEYSIAYDYNGYSRFRSSSGMLLDPSQEQVAIDYYGKLTHEIRISSPATDPVHFLVGAFYQRQSDDIRDEYNIQNLGATALYSFAVPGSPNSLYISQQERIDRDYALFGDATWQVNDKWKLSAGIREFVAHNTLTGFFGFNTAYTDMVPGDNYSRSSGTGQCTTPVSYTMNLPCQNTNASTHETGETHRVNAQYQIDPDRMVYVTYSTGFRPGGPNRRAGLAPYNADTLTNYELGWKTSWLDRHMRFNAAVFDEEWKGVQLGVGGPNGIEDIFNIGNARVRGVEGEFNWLLTQHWELGAAGTYVDALTTTPFCGENLVTGTPGYGQLVPSCPGAPDTATGPSSPSGNRLPVTPSFKGNATARYKFEMQDYHMYAQAAAFHQTSATSILDVGKQDAIGPTPGFTSVDVAYGVSHDNWKAELFVKNLFNSQGELARYSQCLAVNDYCFDRPRIYPTQPQLFGVSFAQRF